MARSDSDDKMLVLGYDLLHRREKLTWADVRELAARMPSPEALGLRPAEWFMRHD